MHPDDGKAKFLRNVGFLRETHSVTAQKTPFLPTFIFFSTFFLEYFDNDIDITKL
jgi:hypothetical protein